MDKREMIDSFSSHLLAIERRSLLTASTYRLEVSIFLDYLERAKIDAALISPTELSCYLEKRRLEDKIDSRSTAKAISCLRSFFRFLINEDVRKDNPALVLELPKRRMYLPEVLDRDQVEKLLELSDDRTPLGLRNRTIYELIYSAGLRISEAVGLNMHDIDIAGGFAKVKGKGSKERIVIFGRQAAHWLRRYLDESRPALAKANPQGRASKALFIGRSGKRISRKGVWKNYCRNAAEAGTGSRLHTLRHSFATDMLAGGADLRSVQELLGHADLSTTQIYTHVDARLLRESHRKYMPKLAAYATKGGSD